MKLEASKIETVKMAQFGVGLVAYCVTFWLAGVAGLLFSNAQYNSAPAFQQLVSTSGSQAYLCDSSRLMRCQQDLARDMQVVGLNAASIQYPIGQGPPYSPAAKLREQQHQQAQQLVTPGTCRLVRANLDCLLQTTPACYDAGLQAAHSTADLALRAKKFLEQQNCNEPDSSWQLTFCYRSPEVRSCEERYGFTVYSTSALTMVNSTSCLAYQAFKYCIDTHLRLNCKVHEIDMANEYLIDRSGDLAWRCPHQNNTLAYNAPLKNPYALSNPSGAYLSPTSAGSGGSYGQYEQRPTYLGDSGSRTSLFGSTAGVRDQPWERFRNPYDDTRTGISRLPGGGGVGGNEIFERLVATGGFGEGETSDCPVKAAPFARECEDTLIEQQRLARDARDGIELQRRICCSLFQYRDCVSRVVLDRCADSSPAAVEILMGIRRREIVLTCRGYNRDLCSGALANALASPLLVLGVALATTLMTFKHSSLL